MARGSMAESIVPFLGRQYGRRCERRDENREADANGAEVREHDYGWGVANDRNLLGRFTTEAFTLARLARTQNYFLRLYDNSSPPHYSRYSAALHVDYPYD
jgi:hypothetical protein